jgi:two-component system, NarL family, invasion response regulator UvrY
MEAVSKNNTRGEKILVANGHAILREKLQQVIAEIPDVVVVAEAKSGYEVMEMANKCNFDLVILDIDLPDRNGLEILREIKRCKPALPVLMFSMLLEKEYAGSMVKAGADGYITADNVSDQMTEAIHTISRGGKYFDASLVMNSSVHPGAVSFHEDTGKKNNNFYKPPAKKGAMYEF